MSKTVIFLKTQSTLRLLPSSSVLLIIYGEKNPSLMQFNIIFPRLLIFGAGNHELEFIGCLTYCLLQLSSNMKIALDSHMRTTWHVNPSGDLESRDDKLTTHQGRQVLFLAFR